jgi:disulfide bond formation protein DsbB
MSEITKQHSTTQLQKWEILLLYGVFLQSVIATLGSLYFSEVMKLVPCVLCWYQRICMYPIVSLSFVGIARNNRSATWYILPLAMIGWSIALFHNLLYYGVIPHALQPCATGVSCTSQTIAWLGFITIPLLSFVAFTIILTLLILLLHHRNNVQNITK